jgi:hypothetical protein
MRKLPITRRALVQRLRRELAKTGQRLVLWGRGRSPRYYIVGADKIVEPVRDLEALGRKLEVLERFEEAEKGTI